MGHARAIEIIKTLFSLLLVSATLGCSPSAPARHVRVIRVTSRSAIVDIVKVGDTIVLSRLAVLPAIKVSRLDMPAERYTLESSSSHSNISLFYDAVREMKCGANWRIRQLPRGYAATSLGHWTIFVSKACTRSTTARNGKVTLDVVQSNSSRLTYYTIISASARK